MWATLLLPLNADDSIDFGRLETQAATLAATELDGLYAHGTAGEFQTLTEAEFDQVNEVLAAAGKPGCRSTMVRCSPSFTVSPTPPVTCRWCCTTYRMRRHLSVHIC